MKRLYWGLVLLVALCAAPALLACEDCYIRGMKNPVGETVDRAMCWSSPEGSSTGCLPYPDGSNCQLWSYGDSCPEEPEGGGGPGGGGGIGGGGDSCTRDASGACPASCSSCTGGGGFSI
jgi:hypothetical protein